MTPKRKVHSRSARLLHALALSVLLGLSSQPASAAFNDPAIVDLPEPVCHDEATVLLVASQFGSVVVVKGKHAPVIIKAAWKSIEKTPPVASKLLVVLGRDGVVRLFAIHRGCVRRSITGTLQAFQTILKDVRED